MKFSHQLLCHRCSTPRILGLHFLMMLCANLLVVNGESATAGEIPVVTPTLQLANAAAMDQDDMCVWVHPVDKERSTLIASDKSAGHVFVYDLEGVLLQTLDVPKPGNIDIRQGVTLDGQSLDLVVVNQRADGYKLVIYKVDPESRQLTRIDDHCATGPNYGGCLYHSCKTGHLFFVCTSDAGMVEQYQLLGNGRHGVTATKIRTMQVGKCEGAVADDESGALFISEEQKGIWKFGAEPDDALTGTLIASIGEHGIKGDLEGLAIFKDHKGGGYLLVSDQGRSRFVAFQRDEPHRYVGEFAVEGARDTDGIEVTSANLGPRFPEGLFACHTDPKPRPVLVTSWSKIFGRLSQDPAKKAE